MSIAGNARTGQGTAPQKIGPGARPTNYGGGGPGMGPPEKT